LILVVVVMAVMLAASATPAMADAIVHFPKCFPFCHKDPFPKCFPFCDNHHHRHHH
jgi:hypothetical protein